MSGSDPSPSRPPVLRGSHRARMHEQRERRNLQRFAQLSLLLTLAAMAFVLGGTLLRAIGGVADRIAMR